MGASKGKGASEEAPVTSKGSPRQKKEVNWSVASQNTRPISSFFQSTKGRETVSTTSQEGGSKAASSGGGVAGKAEKRSSAEGRGGGNEKVDEKPLKKSVPKKLRLVPGQTRLPFVPPRRIVGGSSSTTNVNAPLALPAKEPLPQSSRPQDGLSATALHNRGSSRHVPPSIHSNGALKKATEYPGAYEAVASSSGPFPVSRSFKASFTSCDEDGGGLMAANIRRAATNLSGRIGEMPLIDEELPRAGTAGGQQSELDLQATDEENQEGKGVQLEAREGSSGPVVPQWAPPLLSMEQRLAATSSFHSPLMIIAGDVYMTDGRLLCMMYKNLWTVL